MNIFHEPTLNAIRNAWEKRGPEVIERVPEQGEVKTFLEELVPHCDIPLSDQFFISERDETICVRHKVRNPPKELFLDFSVEMPYPHVFIDLLTATQDYTSRSEKPFSKHMKRDDYLKVNGKFLPGWAGYGIGVPEMVRLISPHFSPLQNFLLEREECFLHIIRADTIPKDGGQIKQVVYLIEMARRHRPFAQKEEVDDSVELHNWKFMEKFERKRANQEDITFWAIQQLVPTDPRNDSDRLKYIQSVIIYEKIRQHRRQAYSEKYIPDRTMVMKGGNHIAMLRARHAAYMDGRARYPVLCAARKDQSLTKRPERKDTNTDTSDDEENIVTGDDGEEALLVGENDAGVPYACDQLESKPKFNEKQFRWRVLGKTVFVIALSASSCFYLYRIRYSPNEGETVRSNTITLFFALLTFFEAGLIFYEYTQGRSLYRDATGEELWKQAVKLDRHNNSTRARVEAVRHPFAKDHFNGVNLSFVGGEELFTGGALVDFTFSLKNLLKAGYETTFSRDGSEILLGPKEKRSRKMFRVESVESVDGDNKVATLVEVKTFEPAEVLSDEVLGTQTLEFTRAAWYQDVKFA